MCAQAIHDGPASNHTGARFQFRTPRDARGNARVIEDTDRARAIRWRPASPSPAALACFEILGHALA
jgi:hypothetical protein